MRKLVRLGVGALAAAVIILVLFFFISQPTSVKVVVVKRATWETSFKEKGEIMDPAPQDIFSKNGGLIKEAFFKDGDAVKSGDILFLFDTADYETQLKQLQNQLSELEGERKQADIDRLENQKQIDAQIYSVQTQFETVRSQIPPLETQKAMQDDILKNAEKKYRDAVSLFDLGEISSSDVDDALLVLNSEKSTMANLDAQIASLGTQADALVLQEARLRDIRIVDLSGQTAAFNAKRLTAEVNISEIHKKIDESVIKASSSGKIENPLKAGQTIPAGTLLATINDAEKFELECFVLLEDLGGVTVGGRAEATLEQNAGDTVFEARVTEIENKAEIRSGMNEKRVRVVLEMSKSDFERLGTGYELNIRFITSHIENSIAVPKTAVFQSETGSAVWVIKDGAAVLRSVEKGAQSSSNVLVESGLAEGDKVVANAAAKDIKEGTRLAAY